MIYIVSVGVIVASSILMPRLRSTLVESRPFVWRGRSRSSRKPWSGSASGSLDRSRGVRYDRLLDWLLLVHHFLFILRTLINCIRLINVVDLIHGGEL